LLDGIEARGQVFVLATTNRPEHVDAAPPRSHPTDEDLIRAVTGLPC
jgi:SpoVK/Ycf46/Vps4 family AAA+-type ATPase